MPKTLADKNIALVRFPTKPVDPAAITTSEWNAATSWSCHILDYRLTPVASDTVQQAEMCQGSNAPVPTRSNFEGNIVPFRYLDDENDFIPDPLEDIVFATLKEKGTTLYLADRLGPAWDAAGAAGQEYSYYEVLTDWPSDPTDRGGYIRHETPLLVQKAELFKTLV